MKRYFLFFVMLFLVMMTAFPVPALADQSSKQIKPETIIRFTKGTLACLTKEDLLKIVSHTMKGESTKANAMMFENDGNCLMIPPSKKVKVIAAEYNNSNVDLGLLEFVAEDKTSVRGAWAFSVGAEPVR